MLKAATIILLLLLLPSCKNASGGNEKVPPPPPDTAHLKNTSHTIEVQLLENATPSVQQFYSTNNNTTVWLEVTDRLNIIKAIEAISADGLEPKDYNIDFLREFEALTTINQADCMRYDILLTESLTKLTTHLFKGKLKPTDVYYDWALSPKKLDVNSLITEALRNHTIPEIVDRCRPRHQVYASLRQSLAYLNALPDDDDLVQIEYTKPLTVNDSTAVVAAINARLAYWGDLDTTLAKEKVFTKATKAAVKTFQARHGIYPDGVVNNATATALNFSRSQRMEQVIANLERWRWFPYNFGERALLINIPDYGMAVVENDKDTVALYKIVVGKASRRTPVLYSALTNLVLNPTWTVPPTFMKEDLTPQAIKDTAYFSRLNIKIFKGNTHVPVAQWDSLKPNNYVYVQSPGKHNSLGRIKFNFKNSFSVYLHDTNHKEYFSKSYRALSSGCVRVENPFKLAGYLLEKEGEGWTKEQTDAIITTGLTESLPLKKTTHVHQLYWTAWMDNGRLHFRNDIYSLDKILYDKLRSQ